MRREHEFRDPIHGLILVTDVERRVINTPVFQRLRRIRQLALADLVYPGALHTRFEHAIGTMHVAHRILERVGREPLDKLEQPFDNDDWQVVRLGALLHDVGHGPFSHVSEYLLDQYYDRQAIGEAGSREKIHERITRDILMIDPELTPALGADLRDRVADLISASAGLRDFRRDIVSSNLDADKMDYLLRDAYFTGVAYGRYDLDKVVDSCRVHRGRNQTYLAVDEGGIFAVEQLIIAKHHMTQQVYAHRIRTITDQLIVRGLRFAIEEDAELRAGYTYDGSQEQLRRYLDLDDAAVWVRALNHGGERARSLFQRLRDRRLLKQLFIIPITDSEIPDAITREALGTLREDEQREIEASIAALLKCEPWEVMVHKSSWKNPLFQPLGVIDPEAIHVIPRAGGSRTLGQYKELVLAQLPAHERFHVFGPTESLAGGSELSVTERVNLQNQIRGLLSERFGGAL